MHLRTLRRRSGGAVCLAPLAHGRPSAVEFLSPQRDLDADLHDQTDRMINAGLTRPTIAEAIQPPPVLEQAWHAHSHDGSANHNVKPSTSAISAGATATRRTSGRHGGRRLSLSRGGAQPRPGAAVRASPRYGLHRIIMIPPKVTKLAHPCSITRGHRIRPAAGEILRLPCVGHACCHPSRSGCLVEGAGPMPGMPGSLRISSRRRPGPSHRRAPPRTRGDRRCGPTEAVAGRRRCPIGADGPVRRRPRRRRR
jgi:hypothetical protein